MEELIGSTREGNFGAVCGMLTHPFYRALYIATVVEIMFCCCSRRLAQCPPWPNPILPSKR